MRLASTVSADSAPRLDGRFPTARFAVLTARSLRPRLDALSALVLKEQALTPAHKHLTR